MMSFYALVLDFENGRHLLHVHDEGRGPLKDHLA